MKRLTPLLVPVLLAAALFSPSPAAAETRQKIGFEEVGSVASPTALVSAPGHPELIYVTTRFGKIRVIEDGVMLPKPLLDIEDMVNTVWVEQGLLGLAFPPDFEKTGRYYIHFTQKDGDIKIDEYQVDPKDPTTTLPFTRRNVIRIPAVSDDGSHNGGQMDFLGNNLYIAIGDGNNPGDRYNLAQKLNSLRGKILRINPKEDETTGRTYQIPPGNPFVNKFGRDEIFAYGFRNPHSFSFEQTKGHPMRMIISDVGQERMEEINYPEFKLAWGANFGWKIYEGTLAYDCIAKLCPEGAIAPTPLPRLTWPVLTYDHDEGCAVIGGPVVEDKDLSLIYGRMIYGDFCGNSIRTATLKPDWITDDKPLGAFMPPGKGEHSALNGFGEDGRGNVYAFSNYGPIYRLVQNEVEVKPTKEELEKFCAKKKNASKKICRKMDKNATKPTTREF
ncbi:MAG: PQQ-dependent sugar dehydrogenase [Solirubrobacterales bacterium]